METLHFINTVAYVLSNVLIAYIALGVLVFVGGYYTLFDPRATTAGRLIFRFFLSLVGIIGLVFIGIYIDPANNRLWYELPKDIDIWRPALRLAVYGYVAFSITSLAILLWLRKFKPDRINAAPDIDLVKVRHETQTIQIIQHKSGE